MCLWSSSMLFIFDIILHLYSSKNYEIISNFTIKVRIIAIIN